MPKHRWHTFKAFVGNHIDPEKTNELRGIKAEIDGKVQKILKFLKDQGDGDSRKGVATALIHEFHNHYLSLYEHYNDLIEKLRKKAHGKKNTSSCSSEYSSSDSDDSPMKEGKNNSKVVIKQQLEKALLEVGELKTKLTATEDEKKALHIEYQSALRKSDEEKSKLLNENASQLESSCKLQAELNQRLEDMQTALFSVQEEKFRLEEETKQTEISIRDLILESSQLSEEHKQSEVRFLECQQSLKSSENKIYEITDQFHKDIKAKSQEIYQLEQNIDDLKTELEMKTATQGKQRLISQKLRITEQLLGVNEERAN